MACFADLAPYAYARYDLDRVDLAWGTLRYRPRYERLSVGWLDASQPFERGPVPDGFAGALLDVLGDPAVNETRGLHGCEFCPPGTDHIAAPRPGRTWLAYYAAPPGSQDRPVGPVRARTRPQ